MIGDPGRVLLSASYKEQTVSNFEERSEQAEGKVSKGAKYTVDGYWGTRSANHQSRYVLVNSTCFDAYSCSS
jgi:hypothetical protein